MTNHDDLIRRLQSEANDTKDILGFNSGLLTKAATAIKELVAERDKIEGDAIAIKELVAERNHWEDDALQRAANTGYWRGRAERAEADLAAARAALRDLDAASSTGIYSDLTMARRMHSTAIAAARAEGGE